MPHSSSPNKVLLYCIFTLGLYFFYWSYKSRQAVIASARQQIIPTTWLLAVPLLNYLWMWQYSQALEKVTYLRIKASDTFLLFLAATIGPATISAIFFDFVPEDTELKTEDIIIICILSFGSWLIVNAIALGLFCKIMQTKLNSLPKQR